MDEESEPKPHRGRWQAQGDDMEEMRSQKWEEAEPPPIRQMLTMLEDLWESLSASERRNREECYREAKRYTENRRREGMIHATHRKSFNNRKKRGGIRIDLEVLAGQACAPDSE